MLRKNFLIYFASLFLLGFPLFSQATEAEQPETIPCLVVRVADGDTLTCLLSNKIRIKIRLEEIDAPEMDQPYGLKSKQLLSLLTDKKLVYLKVSGNDKYNRVLATIYDENMRNINLIMVRMGMAWAYKGYVKDPAYFEAQQLAQQQKIGLWQDPDPIAPYDWRKQPKANSNKNKKKITQFTAK